MHDSIFFTLNTYIGNYFDCISVVYLTDRIFGYPVAPSTLTMRKFSPMTAVPAVKTTINLRKTHF